MSEKTKVEEQTVETDEMLAYFEQHFPGAVNPADREGHTGYVVEAARLQEVGRHIRDELGYDYLSSVTAVDYAADGYYEVVYHAYSMTRGGGPLVFKARAPVADPVLPSLVAVWPGADFQEREAWDLMGVRFEGHPDLRRILMWEGFAGHPLRKDWKEPYYEQEDKPFKSRWPDGHHQYAEERTRWGANVQYPAGFVPDGSGSVADPLLYGALQSIAEETDGLDTEPVVVNMGPQHPSTHGVFRMVVKLDGEQVLALKPVMGYLHRNHEKIGERNTWLMNMPFTDRLDYICSMSNNLGYALAVEKLLEQEVPERTEYLRVIMAEFTRIVNHLVAIGFMFNDLGAFMTPVLYGLKERELILDLFEMASGSRMMCNYMRFGGVMRDVPEEFMPLATELAQERLPRMLGELDRYLTQNEIFRARSMGVGILEPEQAVALSATGPVLRATGVPYDVRRAEPYSIYEWFEFDVITETAGDVYARYMVRQREMFESVRILRQALAEIPEGEIQAGRGGYNFRVPEGDAYGRIESPKGELGFYLVSTGGTNPYRYHVRAPTFINLMTLSEMSIGGKVADVVVNLGSVDIVLGEVDR